MDEEVTDRSMRAKGDDKSVETPAFQINASADSSVCDELREPPIPPARFWTLSTGVFLGLFLSMIDTSIVATSLHSIGVDFQVLQDVNWVALAYTLAYLGCAIVFARISDIVGRRDAFIAAYIIFFVFSLACGFAQTLNQLIAFRALQGVGGSGLYALTMIMMPELSPDNLKQHMAAMVGLVITISGVLGPVLGGILTHYSSWRWVFWINGPIGFVSLAIFVIAWPKAEYLPSQQKRAWKELDLLGSLLAIAAAVLIVFSFQNAGTEPSNQGWNTAMFIAPLICGLFACGLLVSWQIFIQHRWYDRFAPAFPVNIFRNRVYSTAVINTLLNGFPYLLLIYAIPLRFQVVSGKSALVAGVMLLPMLGSSAIGSIVAGKINNTKNYTFESLLIGSCFMTLGCGLLVSLSHESEDAKLLGYMTFCGLGFGLTVASSTMLSMVEVPIRDYAPAQGILSQVRLLGGSLGIATSSALLNEKSSQYLAGVLTPYEQATIGSSETPLSNPQWSAVRYTYADAFKVEMKVATAVAACSVISAFGAFRKQRLLIAEQRAAVVSEEATRRREQGR
ncbi:major facilitator superfamily domain-containing protein [Fusarium flagelliforme]|uniref:major facilitator superfamily domain-containing protein n=1 Tax=Fusarium flagelliforme TaxID=2675880 RepID=UPI001E8CCD12|nr:major facilitator superfamily domain-containing protein [Fusarium flagelliforme]KAH7173618.1 major facilitator superfamily domain-containing protein [Fusarium flagelliforme]